MKSIIVCLLLLNIFVSILFKYINNLNFEVKASIYMIACKSLIVNH